MSRTLSCTRIFPFRLESSKCLTPSVGVNRKGPRGQPRGTDSPLGISEDLLRERCGAFSSSRRGTQSQKRQQRLRRSWRFMNDLLSSNFRLLSFHFRILAASRRTPPSLRRPCSRSSPSIQSNDSQERPLSSAA